MSPRLPGMHFLGLTFRRLLGGPNPYLGRPPIYEVAPHGVGTSIHEQRYLERGPSRTRGRGGLVSTPWFKEFESWMARRGILVRGVPREPMSATTVKVMLSTTKKCMRRVGALGEKDEVLTRLRDIRPDHLVGYFNVAYPKGPRGQEAGWSHDARSLKKFAEFLAFGATWRGRPVFSKKDLERTKRELYAVSVPSMLPDLTEEFLGRYQHKFLPWLKENRPFLWGPAAFAFYSGLRIHEISGIDVGLKTGTMVRLGDGSVRVTGKGHRGQKRQDPIFLIDEAERHLKAWEKVRKDLQADGDAMFPNTRGGRLPIEGAYNRALRMAAKASGLFKGDCDFQGNHATGELVLFHSHVLGRASFITENEHRKVGIFDGMKLSRHRSIASYQRYVRTDARSAARRVSEARSGNLFDQVYDSFSVAHDLLTGLTVEDKKAILRELVGELAA